MRHHVHVYIGDAGSFEETKHPRGVGGKFSKAQVLKQHGYTQKETTRPGYNIHRHPKRRDYVVTTGTGKGAMWHHHTGEPAKNDWTGAPRHGWGRSAEHLNEHLSKFR